ncbi:hypothetical protein C0058_24555 [Pseudomonas sp. NC02]|nr:hypothetical protein C0058_24555 [Pseudomonas sp. NC02]QBQ12968.1 hypothetical protein DCC84_25985 [Pseudomonas sp. SXM-1]
MWERACSRMRWISHRMYQLIHRFREQARSHRGLGNLRIVKLALIQCIKAVLFTSSCRKETAANARTVG